MFPVCFPSRARLSPFPHRHSRRLERALVCTSLHVRVHLCSCVGLRSRHFHTCSAPRFLCSSRHSVFGESISYLPQERCFFRIFIKLLLSVWLIGTVQVKSLTSWKLHSSSSSSSSFFFFWLFQGRTCSIWRVLSPGIESASSWILVVFVSAEP